MKKQIVYTKFRGLNYSSLKILHGFGLHIWKSDPASVLANYLSEKKFEHSCLQREFSGFISHCF